MNERVIYEHRQIGWVTIVAVAVAIIAIFVAAAIAAPSERVAAYYVIPVAAALGALFSSLTIRITQTYVAWWFGIPEIGRRVALSEIASVRAIKTNVFEGWGIHLTWHGWVWNIAGFNAVQIVLRSGTRFAVGTPDPQAVIAAISRARGSATFPS